VVLNLMGNALKFTEGGRVQVDVDRSEEHLTFAVEDTGPGIEPELMRRLFVPFSQGSESREGESEIRSRSLLLRSESKGETSAILVEGELACPQSVGFGVVFERSERGTSKSGAPPRRHGARPRHLSEPRAGDGGTHHRRERAR